MIKILLTIAALLALAPLAQASPTASCTARCAYRAGTTCTAPAYVHVDCIGNGTSETRDSDATVRPFHDLQYKIDYGDSACRSGQGTWANSGMAASKNVDYSPIGAHVYECPGTFNITTQVTDSRGVTSQTIDTVTIESEDVGWNGANTRCVANGTTPIAGQGGCPAGTTSVINSADFDASLQLGAGKRTLYKCGDSFTMDANPNFADGEASGSLVGGYGSCTGNPARITTSGSGSYITDGDLGGWRLRDLRFTSGAPGPQTTIINSAAPTNKFLVLRVETLNVGTCSYLGLEWSHVAWNEMNAFVSYKCHMTVHNTTTDWPTSYGLGSLYGAFIDNYYLGDDPAHTVGQAGNTLSAGNGMRLMGANHFFFSHIRWDAYDGMNMTVQYRSASNETGRHTQYVVMQDWKLYDDGPESFRQFATCGHHACGPGTAQGQDSHVDRDLRDIIFENFRIQYGANKAKTPYYVFKIESADTTIRNIIFDTRAAGPSGPMNFAVADGANAYLGVMATNLSIYNNTILVGGSHDNNSVPCNGQGQSQATVPTGMKCRNNVIYELNDDDTSGPANWTSSGSAASNNLHLRASVEGCPFAGRDGNCTLSPAGPSFNFDELKIRASGGSRALLLNAGFAFPEPSGRKGYVYKDVFLGCRGTATGGPDNTWDIGASEVNSLTCAAAGVPAALAPPTLLNPQ